MAPATHNNNSTCNEIGAMLPQMAAMFFHGFTPNADDLTSPEPIQIHVKSDLHSRIQFLRLPTTHKTRRNVPILWKKTIKAKEAEHTVYRREDQFTLLREFVFNLSHVYNNILMGILGHVTLINMDLNDQSEKQDACLHMEQLIQTGGNLINLIFGYLVERRLSVKRLQLIQLFGDFEVCAQPQNCGIDIDSFKKNMRQIALIHHQSKIIAAVARVMDQLLSWIKDEKTSLERLNSGGARIQSRFAVIDVLLNRGFKIVQNLKYYTSDVKPAIGRMSLRALIRKHIRRLKNNYSRIIVWDDLPKRCPWVFADRQQIDYALRQIIDNAVQAMACKGSLSIRVRTLDDELPSERFAAHSGSDYIVVTISDNGQGMDIHTQGRIFQPFYKTKAGSHHHLGLGLSAASGIVKAHGGFIQLRSTPGRGSIIKIYLPIKPLLHLLPSH